MVCRCLYAPARKPRAGRLPLTVRDRDFGELIVTAQPEAALRLAWQRISALLGIALAMAGAIVVLAALNVPHG